MATLTCNTCKSSFDAEDDSSEILDLGAIADTIQRIAK